MPRIRDAVRRWWNKVLVFVFRRSAAPPPLSPTQTQPKPPDPVPLLAMDITPPPEQPPIAPPQLNRHARRASDKRRRQLERARLKHDVFVVPQGPEPTQYHREHHDDEPPEPALTKHEEILPEGPIFDDPNDRLIVDEWLEGDGEQVLYEEAEFFGEFNFRDTILEQLDRYWVYLARMRKYDKDAYEFYKQMGAILVPYAATGSLSDRPSKPEKITDLAAYKARITLTPWFKRHWPVFGCIAFSTNPRDEKRESTPLSDGSGYYVSTPKFLYFRRVKRFDWHVQPVRGGKCYLLTVWWDRIQTVRGHKYKWGRPQEFPVHISDDGERIRILKTRKDDDSKTRAWWDWQIPHHYTEWAKFYGLTAQTHLAHLFCDTMREIERAHYSMLRVEVSKGDMTAIFGLDPRRTSYFFQDRDIVLNDKGRKKRIFHMVRPFVDKNGVTHPTQFRGMREFTWAGYRVFITVPGRDHFTDDEFNVPMRYDIPKGEKAMTEGEVATMLREQLHKETRTAR